MDPIVGADLTFPVEFNGANYTVFVRKRPYLQRFLEAVYDKFEVVIFTASQVCVSTVPHTHTYTHTQTHAHSLCFSLRDALSLSTIERSWLCVVSPHCNWAVLSFRFCLQALLPCLTSLYCGLMSLCSEGPCRFCLLQAPSCVPYLQRVYADRLLNLIDTEGKYFRCVLLPQNFRVFTCTMIVRDDG